MKNMFTKIALIMVALCMLLAPTGCSKPTTQQPKPKFTVAVSIYAGWMPWYYAKEEGTLKSWADKYNMDIEMIYMDYPGSLDAYVAGKVDAVVMTNMEAMDMPAAAGVDTTVAIVGDYSNGNDAVLVRNGLSLSGLRGKQVFLVEKTVSQYLLARAFAMKTGLKESDVTIVNVSDSDIAPSFLANNSQQAVVTWNPMVIEIMNNKGVTKIFDSSAIPGEIQDLLVVNTRVANAHPDFVRALTGTWYEVMGIMTAGGAAQEEALKKMADLSHATLGEFKLQLGTTYMYYTPASAVTFTKSADIKAKNDLVRHFCFEHGLLGNNAPSVDIIGIQYPDGTIQGDANNVKLRYTTQFMEEAASGKITRK